MRRIIIVVGLMLLAAVPRPARAGVPPVHFHLHDQAAEPTARVCARVWQQRGAELADQLLPVAVIPDTVHCFLLPSAEFQRQFGRRLPDWGVGVAVAPGGVVALDHERILAVGPGPEVVFLHEMTHALLFQGAGEARLPTWLHEGAAMRASGQWRFTDTVSMVLEGRLPSRDSRQGAFPRGTGAADRAYRTSLLAVTWLEREHGPGAVPRIVAAGRRTGDFRAGFIAATGEQPETFASRFAGAMRLRYGWFLLIFRWPTLFVIMGLVFAAGAIRKIDIMKRSLREPEDPPGPPLP